jgi:AcrR family transcriptional regulator
MSEPEKDLSAKILDTAKNLIVNKGYHGMSMREVSDALGVSKAALYYYFKDKEELFLAILKMYLDDMSSILDRLIDEPFSSAEKIRWFVEYVLIQPAEQRAIIRLASQEINQLSPETRKMFASLYREKFIYKLQAILQEGMDRGEFRQISGEITVWALLGIMFPYFYPSHSADSSIPTNTIDEIVQIFLNGISDLKA